MIANKWYFQSDLSKSSSESTISVCSDGQFDNTASTIPYCESPDRRDGAVSFPRIFTSFGETIDTVLSVLSTHYVPEAPPAPYAESWHESDEDAPEIEVNDEAEKEAPTLACEVVDTVARMYSITCNLIHYDDDCGNDDNDDNNHHNSAWTTSSSKPNKTL